jgi:queuosine precursor transporter
MEEKTKNFKFLVPFALFYLTIYLVSCCLAFRIVAVGPLVAPTPPFIFPLTYVLGIIITEVYGSGRAKLVLWSTLGCELFFAIIVYALLLLPAPKYWQHDADYHFVFGPIIHFVLSGVISVLISNTVSIYMLSRLKYLLTGKFFCLRMIFASAIGGLTMVMLIVLLVYMPLVGFDKSIVLAKSIYIIELIYTLVLSVPAWLIANILKNAEGINIIEKNIKFNPFIINLT